MLVCPSMLKVRKLNTNKIGGKYLWSTFQTTVALKYHSDLTRNVKVGKNFIYMYSIMQNITCIYRRMRRGVVISISTVSIYYSQAVLARLVFLTPSIMQIQWETTSNYCTVTYCRKPHPPHPSSLSLSLASKKDNTDSKDGMQPLQQFTQFCPTVADVLVFFVGFSASLGCFINDYIYSISHRGTY